MPASNFATEGDADYEKRLDEQWDTQKVSATPRFCAPARWEWTLTQRSHVSHHPRVQAAAGNMMDENEAMQDLANYVQAHAPSDPL